MSRMRRKGSRCKDQLHPIFGGRSKAKEQESKTGLCSQTI